MEHREPARRGVMSGLERISKPLSWRLLVPLCRTAAVLQLIISHTDSYARRRLALALSFALVSSLITAIAPVALKLGVDSLTVTLTTAALVSPVACLVGYVLMQWCARVVGELRVRMYGVAEQRLQRTLARRVFSHLMALPVRFHVDRSTGALNQTLANGLRGSQLLLHHAMFSLLPLLVELPVVAAVLVRLEHRELLVILSVAAVAYTLAFARGITGAVPPARAVSNAQIDANSVLTDSLQNCEAVKSYDAVPQIADRFDAALSRTESHWSDLYRRRMTNGLIVASVFAASLGAALILAARAVADGTMTVGDLVLVNAYILQLVRPLEMLGFALRDIAQGLVFVEKMAALWREHPENRSDPACAPARAGELRFRDVSFSYDPQRPVLRGLSFTVPVGKTVAVVGMSGAGKSSLVRLLLRLYEPDSGQILLNGTCIGDLSVSSLRRLIAVVPQDIALFNETISYNIAFGKPGSTRQEIEAAAEVACLKPFIAALPCGYETIVGERGLKLSGGEKQRLSIARAVLKRPAIFVFDEATSSLDTRTEREIIRNLYQVSEGQTTLVIAHRLSTIRHAHEIIVLDGGRIIEKGAHQMLIEHNGAYAAMWRSQQSERRSEPSLDIRQA